MRAVADGLVICPAGIYAPWQHCLGCRHLALAEDDRRVERFCSTDLQHPGGWNQSTVAPTSWAELVIELL